MSNATLTILSPVPERPAEADAAPVAWDLPERVRVGLLSNGKPNTAHLLDGLAEVLAADPRVVLAVRAAKESASRPAARATLDELAAGADLVVAATADWGSCTSWSVHDSIGLERAGVRTVTVTSDRFLELGRLQARTLGVPDLRLAVIPHPLAGLDPAAAEDRGRSVGRELVRLLGQAP